MSEKVDYSRLFNDPNFESLNSIDVNKVDYSRLFNDPNFESLNEPTQLDVIPYDEITRQEEILEEELKRDAGIVERFSRNFVEGISPIPVDITSNIAESDSFSDRAAAISGQVLGFGTGLFATGGFLGGLKIVGTGAKATSALGKASKGYNTVSKLQKQAKATTNVKRKTDLLNRAKKIEDYTDKQLSVAGVVKDNSLLGRSTNYRKLISKTGAGEFEFTKFIAKNKLIKKIAPMTEGESAIRTANALDTGLTNMAASSIMFQKTIPLRDEDGDFIIGQRITKPLLDGMLMTAAGLPRVFGMAGLNTLKGSSSKALATEAGLVFATGMGATQMGLGINQENKVGFADNLMDGAIFTAAHYIGVGADKLRIKQAIREGVEFAVEDKTVVNKIVKSMKDKEIDEIRGLINTKRPQYLRNRFINKKDKNQLVQLKTVKQQKSGNHTLSYIVLDDSKGLADNTFTITAKTRQDALNQFFSKYNSVLPNEKLIEADYLKKNPNILDIGKKLKTSNPSLYAEHEKLVKTIRRKEALFNISKNDSRKLRTGTFKYSRGSFDNMNVEQLTTYNNMLNKTSKYKSLEKATKQNPIAPKLPEENFFTKGLTETKDRTNEKAYSFENVLMTFGKLGQELAAKVLDHVGTKAVVRGHFGKFFEDLRKDFKIKNKDFDAITGVLGDNRIKLLVNEDKIKNIADAKLIAKKARRFFDESFIESARDGVEIKTKKKEFEPILSIFDTKGNLVKVSDKSFDNGDVLKILNKKKSSVINSNGKKINVDVDKSIEKSFYIKNYVPNYLSEDGKKFFSIPKNKNLIIASLIKKNPDLDEAEINFLVRNITRYSDPNQTIGILGKRKLDIPPYVLVEKNTNNLIDLSDTVNVSNFKPNQVVTDIDGRQKVIGNIIELYEKDFSKILNTYSNQIANARALARNFDTLGARGVVASDYLEKIEAKYGKDNSLYVQKGLDLSLGGEKSSTIGTYGNKVSKTIANLYLSGPSAALKNLLTGQTQNVMTFGVRKTVAGLVNSLYNNKFYDKLSKQSGALSDEYVDELALGMKGRIGKAVNWLSAPFRAIERLNRRASVAIGDSQLRDSFDVLLNKKGNFFNNKKDATRMLKGVMKLDDESIDYMLKQLRENSSYKSEAFNQLVNTNKRFNFMYEKALFQAQGQTQGVTQLPFLPLWMSENNKKFLTLFYRTAYRVTENTYNRAVVPFIRDGNPFPAMKFITASGLSGAAVYDLYYRGAVGKDLIDKKFQDTPARLFDYAVRGETFGVFSNLLDDYGGGATSLAPVPVQFGIEFKNYILNNVEMFGDAEAHKKLGVDYARKNVSVANQVYEIYRNLNNDINKRFEKQKNLQYKFVDTYKQFGTKKERDNLLQLLNSGKTSEQLFWNKLLSESLITGDKERFKKDFIKTRGYLEQDLVKDLNLKGKEVTLRQLRSETHKRIKTALKNRIRPYPESWDKFYAGKRPSDKFKKFLNAEDKKELDFLMNKYKSLNDILVIVMNEEVDTFSPF
tara:strand:- start:1063 stop:5568 length:4506 start_codon:yes stop_codon:yes gene_type:complete